MLPVPPSLWIRVQAFCASARHGQIILNLADGKIVSAKLIEHVSAKTPADAPLQAPSEEHGCQTHGPSLTVLRHRRKKD